MKKGLYLEGSVHFQLGGLSLSRHYSGLGAGGIEQSLQRRRSGISVNKKLR